MVTNIIVSKYGAGLGPTEEGNRKIVGGPLYRREVVLGLLLDVDSQPVLAWTRKCIHDVQDLGLDQKGLCELLGLSVKLGRFRGAEWCMQRGNGPWAACDAYSIERREWVAKARREMNVEYYVKFAISKSGKKILLASCHL